MQVYSDETTKVVVDKGHGPSGDGGGEGAVASGVTDEQQTSSGNTESRKRIRLETEKIVRVRILIFPPDHLSIFILI